MDLATVGTDVEKVIATEEQLKNRIAELAAQVDADYKDKNVLLVGVLKGAIMAMADLTRAMQSHIEMDWMAVSSYGSGTKSSGVVRILKDLDRDITGRHVLIVEDIVEMRSEDFHVLGGTGRLVPIRESHCHVRHLVGMRCFAFGKETNVLPS